MQQNSAPASLFFIIGDIAVFPGCIERFFKKCIYWVKILMMFLIRFIKNHARFFTNFLNAADRKKAALRVNLIGGDLKRKKRRRRRRRRRRKKKMMKKQTQMKIDTCVSVCKNQSP